MANQSDSGDRACDEVCYEQFNQFDPENPPLNFDYRIQDCTMENNWFTELGVINADEVRVGLRMSEIMDQRESKFQKLLTFKKYVFSFFYSKIQISSLHFFQQSFWSLSRVG